MTLTKLPPRRSGLHDLNGEQQAANLPDNLLCAPPADPGGVDGDAEIRRPPCYKHKGGYHRYLTVRPHSDERWRALRLRRRGRVAGEF